MIKMGKCEHDLAERETACADGYCPLCLSRKLHQLRKAIEKHKKKNPWKSLPRKIDKELYRVLEDL
jgi:hypothetical protein